MYTHTNFKTKKAFKEAVLAYASGQGRAVTYYQPGPFGGNEIQTGTAFFEGPHYPAAHTWYAVGTMQAGKLVKVV